MDASRLDAIRGAVNGNDWWRLSSGEHLNMADELLDEVDALSARLAACEAERAALAFMCKRLAVGFAGEMDLAVHLGAVATWRRCPDDEIDCPETAIHADALDALREWATINGWPELVAKMDAAPPPAPAEEAGR